MKQNVREFYDQIGWTLVEDGVYQNARYEDLRPVSREYIHNCHLRVKQNLQPSGKYLLDAGSGPIQYPEYLIYSSAYQYRICADISITALKEARNKIGEHGLFVVADVANLPFKTRIFDGVVSLHTIHHLPLGEHAQAYAGLWRVLHPGRSAVVVNGWSRSTLMDPFRRFSRFRKRVWLAARRLLGRPLPSKTHIKGANTDDQPDSPAQNTFVEKHNPRWFQRVIAPEMDVEIKVWRTVSVHFLKNYISEKRFGRQILRTLYSLEEKYPRFFGTHGTYPLIVIYKR